MRRRAFFGLQGWYPSGKAAARATLERLFPDDIEEAKVCGMVAPHAGWAYSGATAAKVYASAHIPNRVVVLCPAHHYGGPSIALYPEGSWETPLGDMLVDDAFGRALMDRYEGVRAAPDAHAEEHAIEIQLPFLRFRNPDAAIVPIRLHGLGADERHAMAHALADTAEQSEGETLIVASSDMSHETEYGVLQRHDPMAIEKILAMDADGLVQVCRAHSITMCGSLPAAVAIETCKLRGATQARKIHYTTSAEITGRYDGYSVGYFGAVFE